MTTTLAERLTRTREGMRLFQQERAIQEITDIVCEIMEELKVSRSLLAERLGKSKSYVTQLLDGRANMTVRTISDVFTALDRAVHFQEGPLQAAVGATSIVLRVDQAWGKSSLCWPAKVKCKQVPQGFQDRLAG